MRSLGVVQCGWRRRYPGLPWATGWPALTGQGGYAEMIYLGQEHLVKVPSSLTPADVATLVLNYVTAWQILQRVAKVKAGDKALLIGASGGVGTALLQLGRLAGLKMYGTASPKKQNILTELGAPRSITTHKILLRLLRKEEPNGLDFVFDGMGGTDIQRGMAVFEARQS